MPPARCSLHVTRTVHTFAQVLDVIANQFSHLPSWLRIFVTSREERTIQAAFAKFEPKQLRADEARNRADVEIYLRKIARKHVKGELVSVQYIYLRNIARKHVKGKLVKLIAGAVSLLPLCPNTGTLPWFGR